MNRTTLFGTTLLAAMVTLAALVGVGAAAVPGGSGPAQLNTTDAGNATAPGAQLAGVVGVQQAEVNGDLDNRSFGLRVANAASDDERAAIIAERQNETSQQVATQAQQLADLRAARDAGNLTQSEYRARVAIVASQAANAERTADQLNRTARDLPEAVRERNGINTTAIDRLRADARNLGGPETADIARGISGTTARNPLAGTPRGPPAATPGAGGTGQQRGSQAVGPRGDRGPQADTPAGDTSGAGAANPESDNADRTAAAGNGAAGTDGVSAGGASDASAESNSGLRDGSNSARSGGDRENGGNGPNSGQRGSGGGPDNAGGPTAP